MEIMNNDESTNIKNELWRIGLQTDRKIETTKNHIMFLMLHEMKSIFSEINVTDSTTSKELIEMLMAKTNEKAVEAMLHWEMNDPDN